MANLGRRDAGTSYIFPIPPQSAERNCSATVRSIQFCYIASISDVVFGDTVGNLLNLFNFLTFTQSGSQLRVSRRTSIQSEPRTSICTRVSPFDHICCDTGSLGNVYIPSSSFMFGVEVLSRPLVAFSNSASEFRAMQFQTGSSLGVGSFSLNELSETVAPLPVLRFRAGKLAL